MYKNISIILCIIFTLTSCASVSDDTPVKYTDTIFEEVIPLPHQSSVKISGENRLPTKYDKNDHSENELRIIKRSDTAAVTALKTLSFLLGSSATGFSKSELAGSVLDPILENPTLPYMQKTLPIWIKTHIAPHITQSNRSFKPITITPERFYLVYEKLGGMDDNYILFQNFKLVKYDDYGQDRLSFECSKTGVSKPLTEWQENHYAQVKLTMNQYLDDCMTDLTKQKDELIQSFLPNADTNESTISSQEQP